MAEKVKVDTKTKGNDKDKQSGKVKKKSGVIFKIILILLIVVILAAAGFAVGIYLKFIDMQGIVDKLKLNEYPVVGQYFSQPKTNFETVDLGQEDAPVAPNEGVVPPVQPIVPPAAVAPEKKKIDDVELQKQAKLKQQEEAKRLSKLSKLYGTMKPTDVVPILNLMDDDTVLLILSKMEEEQVAKIMALFDVKRAANLSQNMLKGKSTNTN